MSEPQYIVDSEGTKTGVVLTIDSYQELLEELEDLKSLNERLNEETVSHEEVKAMFS
jgi:hypothetical protein